MFNIPVSPGELIDKITILQIKAERIDDQQKLVNVKVSLKLLDDVRREFVEESSRLKTLTTALREVNEQLWDIEDAIRRQERDRNFNERFVDLARSVYQRNDHRAELKREIDVLLGSDIVEEKSYDKY